MTIPFVREVEFEYGVVDQVSPMIRRVICNNPFESDTEKVAELVRTIQKTNLRKTSLSKLVIQS